MNSDSYLRAIIFTALLFLISACSGGGGGSDNSSNWDEMKWDQGNWK